VNFKEWFYSAPHRAKYTNDHPAYLAAREAWEESHEVCARDCDEFGAYQIFTPLAAGIVGAVTRVCANVMRARGRA